MAQSAESGFVLWSTAGNNLKNIVEYLVTYISNFNGLRLWIKKELDGFDSWKNQIANISCYCPLKPCKFHLKSDQIPRICNCLTNNKRAHTLPPHLMSLLAMYAVNEMINHDCSRGEILLLCYHMCCSFLVVVFLLLFPGASWRC
jgi:hypothetical protein